MDTLTEGIFIAGVAQGPKDIPDSVGQAKGAAASAIALMAQGEVEIEPYFAIVRPERCIGCGMCIAVCPVKAVKVPWGSASHEQAQERVVEYAYGILKDKKAAFVSFVIDVTAHCDCLADPGKPVCKDVGVLASNDPVALDKACYDLVEEKGKKFRGSKQFAYAEKIGLGSTKYELIEV